MIACLPDLPVETLVTWGDPLLLAEGVHMTYANGIYRDPVVLRARPCPGALHGA